MASSNRCLTSSNKNLLGTWRKTCSDHLRERKARGLSGPQRVPTRRRLEQIGSKILQMVKVAETHPIYNKYIYI